MFAKRVSNAHAARREFEAHIRYSLYIDSMPTDEIQPLDTEVEPKRNFLAFSRFAPCSK